MTHGLLWSNRNYRLLLTGSAAANLGDGVVAVALPWLAALLTRDPLMISAVAMSEYLPWFLFALPAGVWTDRADRRLLIMRADAARLALTLCVVALTLSLSAAPASGVEQRGMVAALAAVAFLIGTASVVRGNAAQTLLPSIVAADDLERANGQMWSAEQVMGRFVGPPLAGLLIAAGIVVPFGFNAATLALTIGIVWLIVMLVLYAQEVLHLGAAGYGILLSCGAAGGVLGGLVMPSVARQLGMRRSLLLAIATFVLLNLLLGLFSSMVLAGLALFLEAAGGMLWNIVTVSYRQRLIPDALLGRVNAVYRFFSWGAMPFGAFGAGALVAALHPAPGRAAALHSPYIVAALVSVGLLAYGALRLRFER